VAKEGQSTAKIDCGIHNLDIYLYDKVEIITTLKKQASTAT
jgi:hypothetical protein